METAISSVEMQLSKEIKPLGADTAKRADMIELRLDNSIGVLSDNLKEFTASIRAAIQEIGTKVADVQNENNHHATRIAVIETQIDNKLIQRENRAKEK